MKYTRAPDNLLQRNGFDHEWISADSDSDGPYRAIRTNTTCRHCGSSAFGWTVVNLATATGISEEWSHDDAQVDAEEKAGELNAAWLEGYASNH